MHRTLLRSSARAALALLGIVTACSRGNGATPPEPAQDRVLAVGDSAKFNFATVRVLALQDSRCPSDVQCITGGDVAMILAFSGAGNARTDTLYFVTQPKSTTYGGFVFTPVNVLPYPKTTEPIGPKTLTLHSEYILPD